jgi:predicted phage terminase large subunit-like protein
LIKEDLFYLMAYELNRPDLVHPWLYDRIREVEAKPNGCLDLWAREHYKSTIITFGLTVQDILKNPEITVGIFSHTRAIAQAFLRQIKEELENNVELRDLFPEILYERPRTQSPTWNDGAITVIREGNPKESTVEAWGLVDGQPTGRHFKLRVYDDVVTKESVNTPEQIQKTTQAWELSDNLGSQGGIERYIGTRYHLFDTYRTMMDRGVVDVRCHPCTSDGSEDFDKAVLMDKETLQRKRKLQGLYTFGAQMLLNPKADEAQSFKEEWLKYWDADNRTGLNICILVDHSSGKREKGKTDYTAMWVLGRAGDDNWMVLDMVRDKLNLSGRQKMLFTLVKEYRPLHVFYEEIGLQSDIEHMEYVMKERNWRFSIVPIAHGKVSKNNRIQRLIPLFEAGRIYLPRRAVRTNYSGDTVELVRMFKEQEYGAYPVLDHDDMLDALSFVENEEVQKKISLPEPTETERKFERDLKRKLRRRRDVI